MYLNVPDYGFGVAVDREELPLGCAGWSMKFGATVKRVQRTQATLSRSGVGILGDVGVKIPITAPNATANAMASAIRMTNAASIAAPTVRKDSGLSWSCRYVMSAGNRCLDIHPRPPHNLDSDLSSRAHKIASVAVMENIVYRRVR